MTRIYQPFTQNPSRYGFGPEHSFFLDNQIPGPPPVTLPPVAPPPATPAPALPPVPGISGDGGGGDNSGAFASTGPDASYTGPGSGIVGDVTGMVSDYVSDNPGFTVGNVAGLALGSMGLGALGAAFDSYGDLSQAQAMQAEAGVTGPQYDLGFMAGLSDFGNSISFGRAGTDARDAARENISSFMDEEYSDNPAWEGNQQDFETSDISAVDLSEMDAKAEEVDFPNMAEPNIAIEEAEVAAPAGPAEAAGTKADFEGTFSSLGISTTGFAAPGTTDMFGQTGPQQITATMFNNGITDQTAIDKAIQGYNDSYGISDEGNAYGVEGSYAYSDEAVGDDIGSVGTGYAYSDEAAGDDFGADESSAYSDEAAGDDFGGDGGGGGECFSCDTPILMANGFTKPIMYIKPGDQIASFSGRGELKTQTVMELMKTGYRRLIWIDGVRATPPHPFLTTKGWKFAKNIRPGDRLITAKGRIHAVGHVKPAGHASAVYNLEVDGGDCFVAGGFRVHNSTIICAELHRQGRFSNAEWDVERRYSRRDNPFRGFGEDGDCVSHTYRTIAKPLIAATRRSKIVSFLTAAIIRPWVTEMGYRHAGWKHGSLVGKVYVHLGVPIVRFFWGLKFKRPPVLSHE